MWAVRIIANSLFFLFRDFLLKKGSFSRVRVVGPFFGRRYLLGISRTNKNIIITTEWAGLRSQSEKEDDDY